MFRVNSFFIATEWRKWPSPPTRSKPSFLHMVKMCHQEPQTSFCWAWQLQENETCSSQCPYNNPFSFSSESFFPSVSFWSLWCLSLTLHRLCVSQVLFLFAPLNFSYTVPLSVPQSTFVSLYLSHSVGRKKKSKPGQGVSAAQQLMEIFHPARSSSINWVYASRFPDHSLLRPPSRWYKTLEAKDTKKKKVSLFQELMVYEMKVLGPPAPHGHLTVGSLHWLNPTLRKRRRRLAPNLSQQRSEEPAECKELKPRFFVHQCHCPCYCLVAQSCPTLWDPTDCSLPGPTILGISQARILE